MKTKTTPEQIKLILEALQKLHVRPFVRESCDTKADAQRNLRGRTHYVDEDTLRWHHSRIVGRHIEHGGLVYVLTCSDALDMHNTKRGFRTALFDVFGTVLVRPTLEESKSTSAAAAKVAAEIEIDLLSHYRNAIQEQIQRQQQSLKELNEAASILENN